MPISGDYRQRALEELHGPLTTLEDVIEHAFALIDEVIEYFEKFSSDDPADRACALVTMKGRNLAHACYSLALDGLAQESGAQLFALLQAIELLQYVREIPGAELQVLEARLPSAGKRSHQIRDVFEELHSLFNVYVSNTGWSFGSVRPLIDFRLGNSHVLPTFDQKALEKNLAILALFVVVLGREAARSFHWRCPGTGESLVLKAMRCIMAAKPICETGSFEVPGDLTRSRICAGGLAEFRGYVCPP